MNWSSIKIKSLKTYSTDYKKVNKRTEMVLDMPIEVALELQRQIEVPHVLKGRRKEDTEMEKPER